MRIIYGINPVKEALKTSPESIEKIIISEERAAGAGEIIKAAQAKNIEVRRLPQKELAALAGTPKHQGVAASIIGEFRYKDIEDLISSWKLTKEHAFFLVLDSIQDPQNLGSLIRAAVAAGVHGIIIPKDRACEVTPTVVKASAGASEHALIAREVNLTRAIERLKEEGVWAAAIEAGCKDDIYKTDLKRDLAIVVGSEGKGIRRLVRESCDFCLSIPMSGALNSLNAAQAGAIAIFEARRQRLHGR
jgi:23S rRNA (guanosine2251-2'-O)-methyltransferase